MKMEEGIPGGGTACTRPGRGIVKVCSGSRKCLVYLEHRVDCETKLWKALNARLRPGKVGWEEILTFGDSHGVFEIETAMFLLGCGSHLGC